MTKEVIPIFSILGSGVFLLFGTWNMLLMVLIIAVFLDYMAGIAVAIIKKELSSSLGYRGIMKKVLIFVLVAVAHILDTILGTSYFIRNATILFYICNELISVVENAGRAGIPIPNVIRKALKLFKDQE
ncbi:phage holin family protein [Bacillus spongiae]|uniref:Phage holin family protein n=1 Tax=Bacillus spongiae TaxID=2683610 RepID=A0ABU8HI25_9BACI